MAELRRSGKNTEDESVAQIDGGRVSLAEITARMANERERERLAEIAELIKRV